MITFALAVVMIGQSSGPIRLPRSDYAVPAFPGAFLLGWGIVQDELGLSEEVVKQLSESRTAYQNSIQKSMVPGTVWKPIRDTNKPAWAGALCQITTVQKKRLGEIYFQYYDVNALVDTQAAKLVGLSQEQSRFVLSRLNAAHRKIQNAQEAMFEVFRQDSEELRKRVEAERPDLVANPRGFSYQMPRDVQYRHTDLTRRTDLFRSVEMGRARADIRSRLSSAQLEKLSQLKGIRIPQWFFDGENWGIAQRHPDLVLNINVQAELGFSLRQYLAIQKDRQLRKNTAPAIIKDVTAGLTPDQRTRLKGFELQYDGEYSILRHDVSVELGLATEQIDKILLRLQVIEVDARRRAELEWVKLDSDSGTQQPSYNRIMKQCDADKRKAILYMLTAGQRAKWNRMIGDPLPQIQPSRTYG